MFLRFFFACCAFSSCQVAGETTEYVLLGKEANFKTGIKTIQDEILWKHKGNKVVEFDGKEEYQYGSFKGRVSLNWHSGDLTISDTRFEDSGQYELETFSNNKLHAFKYNLEVLDKVAKPTISCERNKGNGSDELGHQATLTCSAESTQSQVLLKFKWGPNEQLGPKLIIPLGKERDDQVYSCTVSNPLTEESATFNAKECHFDENSSLSIPLIVGLSISFLFLILLLVGCYMCRKACFKCKKTHDIEKQAPLEPTEEMEGGDEEREELLARMPTMPSKQRLNKISAQNKEVLNELRQSFHQRSSAENQNQDLSASFSFPAPEKPPRSPDLPSEVPEQSDEVDQGKTFEDPLVLQPADSEKTNGAVLNKQGSEVDEITIPEKPRRRHDLPPDLEKNKNKSSPPAVPEKTPLVKKFSAAVNENKRLEETEKKESDPEKTKESDDQHSEEKDKVTKSEIHVPESPGPKPTVPESPVPKSPVPKSPVPKSPVPKSPVPKSPVPKSPVPKSPGHKKPPTPKDEDKEDTSSDPEDHAEKNGKESDSLGSGEETTQENDKQVPEESQKPDDVGDKELDPHVNTSKDPQSPTISKPDNSNAEASPEAPDSTQTVPVHEDQDKTRHSSHSETSPEKEDKSKPAEGKNEDQS